MQALARGLRQQLPSGLRSVGRRFLSSSASDQEHMKQIARWRTVTYFAVAGCGAMLVYTFTHEHGHHEKPPAYPYLRIRNKQFPWGDCGLLEKDCPSREG